MNCNDYSLIKRFLFNKNAVHKTFEISSSLFTDLTPIIKIQSKKVQYSKEINIYIWDKAPIIFRYV